MTEPKPFFGIQEFLFEAPLYETYLFDESGFVSPDDLFENNFKIDGYCPRCEKHSTFHRSGGKYTLADSQRVAQGGSYSGDLIIRCARSDSHLIRFHLRIHKKIVCKTGQYPSFADIANDESKQYQKLLSAEDAAELHKAIGLAAHGVGIGAYVYIRRIFERLIDSRFNEWKSAEGWTDEDYKKRRMAERIELLKAHLPEFLVKNKKLYNILSLGIHELNEEDCLGFFSIVRKSVIFILEEDKRKREELALRAAVENEIEHFGFTNDSKKQL